MLELETLRNACQIMLMSNICEVPNREPNRPYLADALKLENIERFGRHFIANVDIEKNQVISMEESFGHVIDINYTEPMCNNCMAQSKNFIPCPDCVDGVFCNDKCMQQGVI